MPKLEWSLQIQFSTVLESYQKNIFFISRLISFITVVLSHTTMSAACNSNFGMLIEPCFIGASLDLPRTKLHVTDLFSIYLM